MEVFKLNSTNYYKVNAAVKYCNDILFNPEREYQFFISAIQQKHFDMSTLSGAEIAARVIDFVNSGKQMNIVYYKSKNPWSKAYGFYTPSRPFDININTRRMNRTTASFVATLVHEMIHAIDGLDSENEFGHGSNESTGKDNTAPYYIGALASKLYGDEQTVESYPRVIRTPWYKRLWNWLRGK